MLKIITKTKYIYNNNYVNQNINDKNISNIKSKNNSSKLLILLTIIFGIGFNSEVVFGSVITRSLLEQFAKETWEFDKGYWKNQKLAQENFIKKYFDSKEEFVRSISVDVIERVPFSILLSGLQVHLVEEQSSFPRLYYDLYKNLHERILPQEGKVIIENSFKHALKCYIGTKASSKKLPENKLILHTGKSTAIFLFTEIEKIGFGSETAAQLISVLSDVSISPISNEISSTITSYFGRVLYGSHKMLQETIKDVLKSESISFEKKTNGDQFGLVYTYDTKKFFVKSYFGYPYRGNIEPEISESSSGMNYASGLSDSGCFSPFEIKDVFVNFKELFAYKVLERFGFGPKTNFIFNPNLRRSLYIITEGIDRFETEYSLIERISNKEIWKHEIFGEKLEDKSFFSKITRESKRGTREFDGQNIIVKLTAMDIVIRSMLLSDINIKNLGFVVNINEPEIYDIKLVDFRVPTIEFIAEQNSTAKASNMGVVRLFIRNKESSERDKIQKAAMDFFDRFMCDFSKKDEFLTLSLYDRRESVYSFINIVDSFILANTFTHYSGPISRVIRADPMSDKDIIYKQYYGSLARNHICQLLNCDDNSNDDTIISAIDAIMQQSKKDVLGFLTNDLLVKQKDFLPKGETVKSVEADLDEYIGGSLGNLRRILDFIRIKKDMNEELITLFETILKNKEKE